MKNFKQNFNKVIKSPLVIGILAVLVIIGLIFVFKSMPKQQIYTIDINNLKSHISVEPYLNSLVRLTETGDVYYKAKDGKRYIFVTNLVVNSWFGEIPSIQEQTIKEMEMSPLGGQISVRPGTLITTETDPNVYIALGGKSIKRITEQQISNFYGNDVSSFKIDLANYYFTAYTVIGDFEEGDLKVIADNQLPDNCLITH